MLWASFTDSRFCSGEVSSSVHTFYITSIIISSRDVTPRAPLSVVFLLTLFNQRHNVTPSETCFELRPDVLLLKILISTSKLILYPQIIVNTV